MKKRIISFAILLSLSIIGITSTNISFKQVNADAVGDTSITIDNAEIVAYNQGFATSYHRIAVSLHTLEDITIDNTSLRYGSGTNFPTISINGNDYTFDNDCNNGTLNGYIALFCQTFNPWTMYFMREAGSTVSKDNQNSGWYNKAWPGIPENEDTYIKFYKDTCIGRYKFNNEFQFYINKEMTKFAFINNPRVINVTGGTTDGTYPLNGNTCANGGSGTVTISPTFVNGKIVSGLSFTDSDGNSVDVDYTKDGDNFIFTMPDMDINVEVIQLEKTYTLTVGDTVINVVPFTAIGTLPEGRWTVDGLEISDESIYIWQEDKVAVSYSSKEKETYTLSLYVDDALYQTITFTEDDTSVELPAIPLKPGYKIIGWDNTDIEYKDMDIHAVYEAI